MIASSNAKLHVIICERYSANHSVFCPLIDLTKINHLNTAYALPEFYISFIYIVHIHVGSTRSIGIVMERSFGHVVASILGT